MTMFSAAMRHVLSVGAAMSAASSGSAQQLPERATLIIRMGSDTIVTDRFERTPASIKGRVQVKGQGRFDYLAVLEPGEVMRSLTLAAFAPGAAADAAPLQRVRLVLQGDTVLAETPAAVHRIPTKVNAVMMFNNALALSEIFTRRARLAGGIANIPYFAVSGGATLEVSIRPAGGDSLLMSVAQQTQRLLVDDVGRIVGGTIAGTNMELVRGPGTELVPDVQLSDTVVAARPDYSAPPGAPYVAEDVRVTGPNGIVLGGTLTRPSNARGRLPAVVTITGSGQQDRDEYIPYAGGIRLFRQVADTLGRRGIAVLRLDDRGIGASGGDPGTSTSADFANDIRAAIAFLRARPDIDPERVGLIGHSEGGAIAPMIAAADARLKAIVLMAAPGEPGIEISMAQNKYLVDRDSTLTPAKRDSILRAARASLDPAKQTNPWIKAWMEYDPAPIARRVKAPTLILQGATDRQVPVDQADKLAALIRAGGNTDVMVRVIPATNHLFVDDPSGDFMSYDALRANRIGPNVLGPLADWLANRLTR
ncbi:MAG: alpha/beta hydrolase family protein [Gemmatimonadaceae bacterium]